MALDIKTTSVVPIRHTFSNVAARLGADKPASRYEEATFDLQMTTNFHYRPLWQPEFELYDVRRTKIVMADWYTLLDPRRFYYGTYTTTRAGQQEVMEKTLEFVDDNGLLRNLPDPIRERIAFALVPLRHVEWAANTNNCYITAYGWGTAVTQATMFYTMDCLGLAQYLGRIGLLLDGNTAESLERAKGLWMSHPAWQGLRRLVEKMFVTHDWFELLVAQNLVLDGLLHPLVFRSYVQRVARTDGPALGLVTEFMRQWFAETSRWVDAVVGAAAAESSANADYLRAWVRAWRAEALDALAPYASELFEGPDAATALDAIAAEWTVRLEKLGVAAEGE